LNFFILYSVPCLLLLIENNAIEGATPNSGMLPGGRKEKDLVKECLPKWKEQVRAWKQGGMKCQ